MKGSIQQQLAVNNKTEQKELMVSMPSVMRTDAAANKARVSVHDPSVIKGGNTMDSKGGSAVQSQITTLMDSDLKRATFRTIEGLDDRTKVSFECVSSPGKYLTTATSGDIVITDGSDPAACTFSISPEGVMRSVIKGDVNADGAFNISDLVLLQKWLLGVPDTKLKNWQAGDLCEDNRLDIFDLCLMRRALVSGSE